MSAEAALVALPVGATAGLAAGWLSVMLERVEKLEQENREDRDAYIAELATSAAPDAPAGEPWPHESFGWTWLERALAPVLGAAGFAAFAAHEELGTGLVIHLVWVTLLIHVVVVDLKHRLILNRVTYPAIVLALVLAQFSPGLTLWRSVIGCVSVGAFFLLLNVVSRGGIGLGDAKLGALVGAISGLGGSLDHIGGAYAVIYGIFLGGAAALLLLLFRVRGLKDAIPYGPFLCVGAGIILFEGP